MPKFSSHSLVQQFSVVKVAHGMHFWYFGISGTLQDILMKLAQTFKPQPQDNLQSFVTSCQQETHISSFFHQKIMTHSSPFPALYGWKQS